LRYGVAKGASEHLVLTAHAAGTIPCTIVRPGDVYGPGSRAWLIEPLKLVRARSLILPDHGNGRFSPVYIDDLLAGTLLAATRPEGAGHVFTIAGGYSVPAKEFFGYHWRWAGRKGDVPGVSLANGVRLTAVLQRVNRMLGRVDEACPDSMYMLARRGGYSIDKARRLLGYDPQTTLEDGMRRSEQWLREIGELK
jgi:nucleoside-diphosphate-sugar epimerase